MRGSVLHVPAARWKTQAGRRRAAGDGHCTAHFGVRANMVNFQFSRGEAMKAWFTCVCCAALLWLASAACAQDVNGSLTANGKSASLKYVIAQEVDSVTEKGYMDVIVVLSDRK